MSVAFNNIPGNIRVPYVRIEVNAGQSPYASNSRLLLIGQMLASGVAHPGKPLIVTGSEDGLFGIGSQLAVMYKLARKNGPLQEIWALPLLDVEHATKAALDIALSGVFPVEAGGTIVLYVDGDRISVPIDTSMTQAETAASIAAYINANSSSTVLATVSGNGVQASGIATITGKATSTGSVYLTVGGTTYIGAIALGDEASIVAASLAAAINEGNELSATVIGSVVTYKWVSQGTFANAYEVTSSVSATGVAIDATQLSGGTNAGVTLTARNGGTLGNGIGVYTKLTSDDGDFADNLLSNINKSLSGGASDPDLATALASLGEDLWDFIACPYSQIAHLDELDNWLSERWGPMSQTYGSYYTALVNKTAGEVLALTESRNGPHGSLLPMNGSPQAAYRVAAAYAAVAAVHLQDAPELSRPLHTLVLEGILPPKQVAARWSLLERQSFYYGGASGYTVNSAGQVVIDRAVTFFQRDAYGNPSSTWLDVNTLAQLMYGLRFIRQYVEGSYPRCALVNDNVGNLQGFVTPVDIFNAMVHAYKTLEDIGVFQDSATFQSMLVVERNSQDPNRLDTYLPLEAVNQLRVLAVSATSFAQYPTSAS